MSAGHEKPQIGRVGELLVQARLLLHGIDSAPMTTDRGIDLIASRTGDNGEVMYVSIQVKATSVHWETKEGLSGHTWGFPKPATADLIAFVAVDKIPERIWLFDYANLCNVKKSSGDFDLYTSEVKKTRWTVGNFEAHLLEKLEDKLSPPLVSGD